MRRILGSIVVVGGLVLAPHVAHASFHLWTIEEVYSNASGDIQYIELATSANSQQFLNGATIVATSNAGTITFTFPGNSGSPTAGKTLLIATPGFSRLAGAVTPDFTLPCGPFFDPADMTITIDFGAGSNIETITTGVPTNGTSSYNNGTVAAASPKNFAGSTGTLNPTTCQNDGTCDICDDGLFCNGTETCAAAACTGTDPCPGEMCDETDDSCFECDGAEDCDDDNVCTDDSCDGNGDCVNANNTMACNDGLFCTQTDACSGGTCMGTGDACAGDNCNEGGDFCGDCDDAGDCDDGTFCDGVETCTAGDCGEATAGPCDLDLTTCEEDGDACVFICGNGALDTDEGCDDGNATDGDGCTGCAVDDGFTCDDGEPSVCDPIPDVDAMVPDAEPAPDAGVTPPPDDQGCCSTGRRDLDAGTLLLLALAALSWRTGRFPARRARTAARRR